MASIKEVENQIAEVDAKVEQLVGELAQARQKLEQLVSIQDDGKMSPDELAGLAQEYSSAAKALGDQVDSIEAAMEALRQRRARLENELHELQGTEQVKQYKQRLRRLYSLCARNNQVIDELIQVRASIGELEKSIRVPSHYHETKAYVEAMAEGWVIPTLQVGIGETTGELRKTSHLGIGLPPIASKVNE